MKVYRTTSHSKTSETTPFWSWNLIFMLIFDLYPGWYASSPVLLAKSRGWSETVPNYMIIDIVHDITKLLWPRHHTSIVRGWASHFCDNFDFLFVHFLFTCSACACLMLCAFDSSIFAFPVCCRWFYVLFILLSYTKQADSRELVERHIATTLAGIDAGVLRFFARRSPMTMLSPDTRYSLGLFF